MSKERIRSITKKHRPYPSKEKVIQLVNLLKQDFTAQTINEKWVADIHTLKMDGGYLATVLSLHSKKIVGQNFLVQ